MPRTKEGGWIIDDKLVIFKKNPYIKLFKKENNKKRVK